MRVVRALGNRIPWMLVTIVSCVGKMSADDAYLDPGKRSIKKKCLFFRRDLCICGYSSIPGRSDPNIHSSQYNDQGEPI